MPRLTLPSVMLSPAHFDELRVHGERTLALEIPRLLQADPGRAARLSLRVGPIYANFARQRYDVSALDALFALADAVDFPVCLKALFDGAEVNATEARPALHTSLRSEVSAAAVARQAHAEALQARQRMGELVARIHAGDITDVVSVGIGGSDLGPRLVVDALAANGSGLPSVHFVSNVDPAAAARVMAGLDAARTAVVLISKSFGTQETLLNGRIFQQWLGDDRRLYAVTANVPAAAEFGIAPERTLPMWDWVGGRYSLWSAVGFPIALALGMEAFEELLSGAAEMDAHVLHSPVRENLAAWHALTAVWNRNALGLPTQSVQPYAEALRLLPAYLQQLVMESLGKRVRSDGSPVVADTVPVWWGGVGTDTQHSYFQALHQGTQLVPMDFIGVASTGGVPAANGRTLLANLLAQAESLANGELHAEPHRVYPGGRPSTMFLLDELSPRSLGALVAMYEHSVFLQAMVWGINPFDQFGVELGKQVAARVLPALDGQGHAGDPVTRELLRHLSATR